MSNLPVLLESAFPGKPALKRRIEECISASPQYTNLILEISSYICKLRQAPPHDQQPSSKKRRLDEPAPTSTTPESGAWEDPSAQPVHSAPGTSFSLPQRSRLRLEIIGGQRGGVRAVDPSGKSGRPYEFGLGWAGVEQVFCVPVPERQKRAWNFVVVPRGNDGVAGAGLEGAAAAPAPEQVLWTYQELSAREAAAAGGPPAEPGHMVALLDGMLAPFGRAVVRPEDGGFASAVPQAHRRGEKAYHVTAFRGSKEGYLFFLPTGILWGFKKPVAFFAFGSVASVSYTSVLQRTFNLVIATNGRREGEAGQEVEFSMLDQQDFAGIDAYVKGHGLNDTSLAKERAAKLYNVNRERGLKGADAAETGTEANGDVQADDEDGLTELQRAEQQLQDEEDDMEEDYDPGSEGESEGEGGSEEEDDYQEGEGEGDDDVAEEGEEYDDEAEEYDEGEEDEKTAPQPTSAAPRGFAVLNGHGRPPPDEPDDGFL